MIRSLPYWSLIWRMSALDFSTVAGVKNFALSVTSARAGATAIASAITPSRLRTHDRMSVDWSIGVVPFFYVSPDHSHAFERRSVIKPLAFLDEAGLTRGHETCRWHA